MRGLRRQRTAGAGGWGGIEACAGKVASPGTQVSYTSEFTLGEGRFVTPKEVKRECHNRFV